MLNAIEYYIIFLFLFIFLLLLFVGYSPGWPSEVDIGTEGLVAPVLLQVRQVRFIDRECLFQDLKVPSSWFFN